MDNLWKSILESSNEETKVEPQSNQPTIQLPNPVQPAPTPQTGIDLSSLFQKPAVAPVLPQPANPQLQTLFSTGPQPQAQVAINVTNPVNQLEVIETDDEDFDDDLDDLEDEIDTDPSIDVTPIQNTFNLNLPNVAPQVPQFGIDLGNMFNVSPTTNVQPPKRGRGRPPKATNAQDVINLLPQQLITEDDKSKSNINIETTVSQIKQATANITAEIPKESLKILGESMVRIGETLIQLGN